MSVSPPPVRLFIGSSSEGLDIARRLESDVSRFCEPDRWDRDVFEPGGVAIDSLRAKAHEVDFAVLIATPDDQTSSRGDTEAAPRDNVVLEYGLFAGVLGRERVYLLGAGEMKLPTDISGITRLPYRARSDGNVGAALNSAVLQIEDRVAKLGSVSSRQGTRATALSIPSPLDQEILLVCTNAHAQGWVVKTNSTTTLRLRSPHGKTFTLAKMQPAATRENLRKFAAELKADGLRVNRSVTRPVGESPLG